MGGTVINQAAWQCAPGHPLRIGVAEPPELAAHEIRIRNAAIAINPIDWILQEIALLPWLEYPAILEATQGPTQGRGRDAEAQRGVPEAACFVDRHEGPQLGVVATVHHCFLQVTRPSRFMAFFAQKRAPSHG